MSIGYEELKQQVLEAARKFAGRGPGYSQQRVVLLEVASELGGRDSGRDLGFQQTLLTCWNDLIREGKLSWGYNLDNPDSPFFHIPQRNDTENQPRL